MATVSVAVVFLAAFLAFSSSVVICPGGEYYCPDGNTCCLLGNEEYGCCPLPNAVCCSDHEHCCPEGYSCAVANGTCFKSDVGHVLFTRVTRRFSDSNNLWEDVWRDEYRRFECACRCASRCSVSKTVTVRQMSVPCLFVVVAEETPEIDVFCARQSHLRQRLP